LIILSYRTLFSIAILAAMSTAAPAMAQAPAGILECNVSASTGAVVTSTKLLACVFHPANGGPEFYDGSINTLGLDLGSTGPGRLQWAVAVAEAAPQQYPLAGTYTGATAGVTVGTGGDAHTLIGGNGNAVSLQPLSVSSQTGLDVTAGISSLTLTPANPPPPLHH